MLCVVRDFLTAEDKEAVFSADHFPLWYKRAAEQVPGTFIYSLPFHTGDYTHKTGSLITLISLTICIYLLIKFFKLLQYFLSESHF